MKKLLSLLVVLIFSIPTFAHEGGHGHQTEGIGKYGGLISKVVLKSEMTNHDAKEIYKAELVRSQDETVRVYLYNKDNSLVDLNTLEQKAAATIETKNEGQFDRVPFEITVNKNHFLGKAPEIKKKPFNLEIIFTLKESSAKEKELFVSFQNLD